MAVRRLLQQFKAAGLIEVARGTGGTTLKKQEALESEMKHTSLADLLMEIEWLIEKQK